MRTCSISQTFTGLGRCPASAWNTHLHFSWTFFFVFWPISCFPDHSVMSEPSSLGSYPAPSPLLARSSSSCSLSYHLMYTLILIFKYYPFFFCGIHESQDWVLFIAILPETQKMLSALDNYLINCTEFNWTESGDVLYWGIAWVPFLALIKRYKWPGSGTVY